MALPTTLPTREYNKFKEVAGETAVRTSVAESALPSGAATASLQTTGNALLARAELVVSTVNSSATPLSAAGAFAGIGESITDYQEITINLAGAPFVAPGTIYFEFSPDNVNWDVSVPTILSGPNQLVPFALRNVLPYFRIRYVNGATPLTEFRLTSVMHRTSSKHLTRFLSQDIGSNEPVENVRSFSAGITPNGNFINLPAGSVVNSNSSMTLLLAAGTFTGTYIDQTGYGGIVVSVNASHDGTLFIENSSDALTVSSSQSYPITGGSTFFAGSATRNKFVRIRYVNGATNQTAFDIQTIVLTQPLSPSSQPINTPLNSTSIAVNSRSVITGEQENGTFSNVQLSNAASLKVAVSDRQTEVRDRTDVAITDTRRSLVGGGGNTIYTVPAGKYLYITSFVISFLNDLNAIGEWHVRDGTTAIFPFIVSNKAVGAASQGTSVSPNLENNPVRFTTNVNLLEVTGDIITTIFIKGYLEAI